LIVQGHETAREKDR